MRPHMPQTKTDGLCPTRTLRPSPTRTLRTQRRWCQIHSSNVYSTARPSGFFDCDFLPLSTTGTAQERNKIQNKLRSCRWCTLLDYVNTTQLFTQLFATGRQMGDKTDISQAQNIQRSGGVSIFFVHVKNWSLFRPLKTVFRSG